ncbi:hypothetical protein GLOIN_2v1821835 [Rhizophagus clarus]|uniref:Uncharacterized protein n=1 Tax=Rhizophagus clarus TaxID=94130 RepID=A0A8H3LXY5_9GLOM|nr:hypothetical protein GLOIN_2v1821835 [Rhizophagus clarus]
MYYHDRPKKCIILQPGYCLFVASVIVPILCPKISYCISSCAGSDEYLSDLDSYNGESNLKSDDYYNYKSNYKSDSEEALCTSISITTILSFQYSLRQEKFNDNFSFKDLLNAIREIFLSPPRDMSDEKGSLEYLPIYLFLFLNEKGSCLYNAYDWDEVENKLVIKIDQDNWVPKFFIADDILEVYVLPEIHECINSQKPLRAVIDIDASKEDMETASRGSRNSNKCSYHILYTPVLLIDHHELKAFTELVYTITGTDEPGEVFECDPSIAEKIRQENKKSTSSPSIRKIKGPSFPRAFVKMPSWAKYNKALTATEIYEKRYIKLLPDKEDIYVDSPWETGKTYILEHLTISDNVNLLVLFT